MKKSFALITVALIVLSMFAGCSSAAPASSPAAPAPASSVAPANSEAPASSAEPASSAAADGVVDCPKMNIVLSSHLNPGSPENEALKLILKTLGERTGGNITGTVYEGSSLAAEVEAYEHLKSGSINISFAGFTITNKFGPTLESFATPYMYSTKEQVLKSWEGRIGEEMRKNLLEAGIVGKYMSFRGNRQLTSNKPIHTPADLAGLKLRVPETASWITVWKSMGALPTPIATSEVFSSLQMGVIDAQENSITSNYNKGLWEVQKYTILTNHIIDMNVFEVSRKWYETLSPEMQTVVDEVMKQGADYCTEITLANEEKLRAEMEQNGMEFIEIDAKAFAEAAAEGVREVSKEWEDWVYGQAMEDIASAS